MSVQTQVEIFGRSYTIKGESSEATTRRIAKYVDGKMHDVANNAPHTSPERIGILAALDIANELFELRDQHEASSAMVASKASQLLSLLEKELAQESMSPGSSTS